MGKEITDILGIKEYGEATKIVVKETMEGARAFLGRVCNPAAGEFGLLLQDKVRHWRNKNLIKTFLDTERILLEQGRKDDQVHPRMLHHVMESASLVDDVELQKMWSGILASSCNQDGKDDSNLVFMNLLDQLTAPQVKFVSYLCENSVKKISFDGLIYAEEVSIPKARLIEIWNGADIHRIDSELDSLRALDLISSALPLRPENFVARIKSFEEEKKRIDKKIVDGAKENDLKPSERMFLGSYQEQKNDLTELLTAQIAVRPIGIHLYVRCQGVRKSPIEFFNLK